MSNSYVNKVIFGGDTLIDLTVDTVTVNDVLSGKYFHLPSGERVAGTSTYDADTSDATAAEAEILDGKTAYKNGVKLTGTMPHRGAVAGIISALADPYIIQNGYHDGSGTVGIDAIEAAKIIPSNIKSGISMLGIVGTYSGEAATVQAKTAIPSTSAQTILPDANYDYLSQVTVEAIPVTRVDNISGGVTVTIG